jgi:hypothetical protein
LPIHLEKRWDFADIEPMSTDAILSRLNQLGIAVTSRAFRQAALRQDSAERLADEWRERYILYPEWRDDEDFVWMSAIVLWKRLIPERICFEQISEHMQDGYDLLEKERTVEACDAWWQVWEWLKDKVSPERQTIEALDADFRGVQSVYSWCQDFEMELGNAGLDDLAYYRLRIRYCREFLETFSNIEWLLQGNFRRAEAQAYWRLGEVETAEARLEDLIQANPDWAWGYIGWSDLYWLYDDSPKDYARGEAILRRALVRANLEDREHVVDRHKSLRIERTRARQAQASRKQRGRRDRRRRKRRRK